MKKQLLTIENVKQNLEKMKGEKVKLSVNKGRKKIIKFEAVLTEIYPSVFTVTTSDDNVNNHSYSYTEVLCGNVKVAPKNI